MDVSAFLFTKVDSKRSPCASWHAHPHLLEFSRTFVGKIRISPKFCSGRQHLGAHLHVRACSRHLQHLRHHARPDGEVKWITGRRHNHLFRNRRRHHTCAQHPTGETRSRLLPCDYATNIRGVSQLEEATYTCKNKHMKRQYLMDPQRSRQHKDSHTSTHANTHTPCAKMSIDNVCSFGVSGWPGERDGYITE